MGVSMTNQDQRNKSEALFDVLNQDLQTLFSRQQTMQKEIQRLRRVTRADDEEQKLDDNTSREELARAIINNTDVITALVVSLQNAKERPDEHTFYYASQRVRDREVSRSIAYKKRLKDCEKKAGDMCSCGGEHRAILFFERKVSTNVEKNQTTGKLEHTTTTEAPVLIDTLCPRVWWIFQSQLAFEAGGLGAFTRSTPLPEYMARHTAFTKQKS